MGIDSRGTGNWVATRVSSEAADVKSNSMIGLAAAKKHQKDPALKDIREYGRARGNPCDVFTHPRSDRGIRSPHLALG